MPHATATVDGLVIAETDSWEVVEGNVYFPASSITDDSVLKPSDTQTFCPWKGTASYYTINVNGKQLKDAAWFYPEPLDKAANLKNHIAFYKSKVDISSGQ